MPLALRLILIALVASLVGCDAGSGSSTASRPGSRTAEFLSGSTPPQFTLNDLSGKPRTLAEFSGKTVLLNFWATWCVPCVAEMPAFERLYQLLRDKGLEVVAISVDRDQTVVKKFAEKNGLTFTILHDPDLKTPPRFNVGGFPESFLLDRQGNFVEFVDPQEQKSTVRIVSDRPWDAEPFIKAIESVVFGQEATHR